MISLFSLIRRSLFFYRKSYMGVCLGIMIAAVVLTGALLTGDSVRHSLKEITRLRLGNVRYTLFTETRLFRRELADEIENDLGCSVVPALTAPGIAIKGGGVLRINGIQVLGISPSFNRLSQEPMASLSSGEILISPALARRLGVVNGEEILLRIKHLQKVPSDQLFSNDGDLSVTLRCKVAGIASNDSMGRFSLQNSQEEPLTAFVPLEDLQAAFDSGDKVNLLLSARRDGEPISIDEIRDALIRHWKPADGGLFFRLTSKRVPELLSERIFLDKTVEHSIPGGRGILTYFVNRLSSDKGQTPYSFISAPGDLLGEERLEQDEILLTAWTAEDLKAVQGDRINIAYYIPGEQGGLIEKESVFRVKKIIPITEELVKEKFTPEFPGLLGVDNCRDWETDIPIDLKLIRDKDEKYWDLYGATPKAFISSEAARTLWSNRFGSFTSIRYPGRKIDELKREMRENLAPGDFGFIFKPSFEEGLAAGEASVDFGQLFLGLSFFLILSALLLTAMLFVLGLKGRTDQMGLLLSLGYTASRLKGLYFAEGAVIALLGAAGGTFLGLLYTGIILEGLKSLWIDAVGTSTLILAVSPFTLVIGFFISLMTSLITLYFTLDGYLKQNIRQLTTSEVKYEQTVKKRNTFIPFVIIFGSLALFLLIIILGAAGIIKEPEILFFTEGFLMLLLSLAVCYVFFIRGMTKKASGDLSFSSLGMGNLIRRRKRSLATVALLGCGVFMILSVGAHRLSLPTGPMSRSSGTGGFLFVGKTSIPVLNDLNERIPRLLSSLEPEQLEDTRFVQLRLKEGDEASCLNLNQIGNPSILGVNPGELDRRRAFSFSELNSEGDKDNPWESLNLELGEGVIPGIADQTVITWSLGKGLGDTLSFKDEGGREFRIKLVGALGNSIFQGNLLISEKNFKEKFPSISGYRFFLMDAPFESGPEVQEELTRRMRNQGLDLESSTARLARFNSVENTYLSIFLVLGGLGLLLGTFGFGILVLRNIMEDKQELAVLRAVGFRRRDILSLVFWEHIPLVMMSLACGIVSSVLALLPGFLFHPEEVPFDFLLILIAGIFVNSLLWIILGAFKAVSKPFLPQLREE